MSARTRSLVLGLLTTLLVGSSVVYLVLEEFKDPKEQALALEECREQADCAKPNYCFGKTCVFPCEKDADCAASWLCSGREDFVLL